MENRVAFKEDVRKRQACTFCIDFLRILWLLKKNFVFRELCTIYTCYGDDTKNAGQNKGLCVFCPKRLEQKLELFVWESVYLCEKDIDSKKGLDAL